MKTSLLSCRCSFLLVRSLPRRNENQLFLPRASVSLKSEAYLEGMKTCLYTNLYSAFLVSEAYLEGMKTCSWNVNFACVPMSEAYLEGMKTFVHTYSSLLPVHRPKPTSKE